MERAGGETSFAIVRKLKSSPRAVWRALTLPDMLKHWMVPGEHFQVLSAETDVRVGGQYRIVLKTRAGDEHDVSGVYREVIVNTKLVYTWTWKSKAERESQVTIELTPAGDGTELLLRHEGFEDDKTCGQHEQCWKGCLRRLARLLA